MRRANGGELADAQGPGIAQGGATRAAAWLA